MYPPAARRAGCGRHRLAQLTYVRNCRGRAYRYSCAGCATALARVMEVAVAVSEELVNVFLGRAGVLLGLSQFLGAC